MPKNLVVIALLSCGCCFAQSGTAPTGYYPLGYTGSTFSGAVTARDATKQEITLTYENKKKNKTENFVGVLEGPCQLPTDNKTSRSLRVEDIPDGTVITAFYNTKSHKENGKKVGMNQIIMISFDVLDGKTVPEANRVSISCRGNSKK